jgi:hypothetical protein
MLTAAVVLAVLMLVGVAYAAGAFTVKADEFDPGRTNLVQGAWLAGIGCPTNAKTATPNATFTDFDGFGTFTDPACPTGDASDKANEGLLLAKTGPTVSNFAAAFARIDGVRGETLTELGWDIRKPGADGSAGPRGSHCGAGAPRWNVTARNPDTGQEGLFFIGCNSPPPTTQQPGIGYIRMRWGGDGAATPLPAFPAGANPPCTVDVTTGTCNIRGFELVRLSIVFDEGYDTGPDNFGLAVLDNIDVNSVLVGQGNADAN